MLRSAFEEGKHAIFECHSFCSLICGLFPPFLWSTETKIQTENNRMGQPSQKLKRKSSLGCPWEINRMGKLAFPSSHFLIAKVGLILHLLYSQFAWQTKEQVLLPKKVLSLPPSQLFEGFFSEYTLNRSPQEMGFPSRVPERAHVWLGTSPRLRVRQDFKLPWGHVHYLCSNIQE